MPEVIFRKASYKQKDVSRIVSEMLDRLIGDLITSGSKVLIKPNLLAPAPPESAVVTHPMVVRAVAEYVLDKGGRPRVSDSPAMGTFAKVLETSGIRRALDGLNVECREFRSSDLVDIGGPFNKIEIARYAMTSDVVINLPKLKTHSQMLLTIAVKNLYGCIVGFRKPEWHYRTGVDRRLFARLLVQICRAVSPEVTIVDGIVGMEGQGPGRGGTPKEIGMLIGGADPFSIDLAICDLFGIDRMSLPTNMAAADLGLHNSPPKIAGDVHKPVRLRLPDITPVMFGPEIFHGLIRKHFVQRPVCEEAACRLCGDCTRYCPAKAISMAGRKIRFDYEKCIRCYCCIEVCPHAALRSHETNTGKIVRKILKKK